MTYKVQQITCPACRGHGRVTSWDYRADLCEECEGRMVVDASCACCDRIEPIDAEGFCRDCSDDVSLTVCVGDPLLKRRAA